MAKKGSRSKPRTKTRTVTVTKWRTRAMKVGRKGRRIGRSVSSLAKDRGPTTLFGAVLGYLDRQKGKGGTLDIMSKVPTFGGLPAEAVLGIGAHYYAKSNRGSRRADQFATAALAIGAYKYVSGGAGGRIAGVGGGF